MKKNGHYSEPFVEIPRGESLTDQIVNLLKGASVPQKVIDEVVAVLDDAASDELAEQVGDTYA